jgi:ribosomal protein L11 methyltransferase
MAWLSVKVDVPATLVEPLSDWFSGQGALAVTAADAGNAPILEPDPQAQPLWPTVRLDALFAGDTASGAVGAALEQWFMGHGRVMPHLDIDVIADEDWSSTWRAGIEPQCYRERLWVIPRDLSWDTGTGTAVLRLDPGLAFGTGSHATTALCLDWLAGADLEGLAVVDYGCGSGILGIAALLLGAASVAAVDHDPQALTAARDNAAFNRVDPRRFTIHLPSTLPQRAGGYDLIVANILGNPLIELAPRLVGLLKSGGRVLLSGVLEDQVPAVTGAYPGVRFGPPSMREDWACIAGIIQHGSLASD